MLNKRIYAIVLASVMTASLLAGCGSSTDTAEASTESSLEASTEETKTYAADAYLSGITASDYVELPDYSKIPVDVTLDEVTDDDVDAAIESNLSADQELVEITDRDTVEDGDVVNIDYVGKKDGVAFDGGTASGYDLTIGSGSFIDGFEDGIIGMKKGETKVLTLTFPENYGNSDLAGQETTFDVTVNKIQAYDAPELTDAWVAEQDIEDVTTVDEYKAYIRGQLEETAQENYDSELQTAAGDYVYNNATWKQDPPTAMVDRLYDNQIQTYETYAGYYGVDLDSFLETIGASTDDVRSAAEDSAKYYIALQAVADQEGLNLAGEDLENEIADLAASYGYDDAAAFEETAGSNEIGEYLTLNNVAEFLAGNAVYDETASETSTEATTEATAE